MNRLLPFALALFAATMFFTACGDDDSSSGYVHKNDTSASCGVDDENCECEDDDCDVSSSSKKTAASSSAKEKNDSSSAKSSSSTGDKNSGGESSPASSSVKSSSSEEGGGDDLDGASSSSEVVFICEEGETRRNSGVREVCQGGYWVPVSSSSAVPTSSYFDMTNQFNEKVSYGEFTDPRDGQKYRTMEVKNGVFMESYTFFAENLNYGKMVSGGSVQGDSSKYCYDDDPWYCENGWGGLYTWSRAMNFPAVCDSVSIASEKCPNKFNLESDNEEFNGKYYFVQHQGICPEGWHIMNENEWVEISEKSSRDVALYMGSKVAGFGSNDYGLSLLPAGYWLLYPSGTMAYDNITKQTVFWLPEQNRDQANKAKLVNVLRNDMTRSTSRAKSEYAHSVRCVKNY